MPSRNYKAAGLIRQSGLPCPQFQVYFLLSLRNFRLEAGGMGPEGIQFRPRSTPLPPLGSLTELRIEGMDCGNCARAVTEALQAVSGVSRSVVDLH